MENLNAVITGVGGYVPDYVLTNDEYPTEPRTYRNYYGKLMMKYLKWWIPMMNGLWGALV